MFNALQLRKIDENTVAEVVQLDEAQLPDGDITVDVEYSSLNYKDGLAITGKGRIIRNFPMVPGIDFAGKVSRSTSDNYQIGDAVILTGWGVGENHWGGMAAKASVKSDWLVPLPTELDCRKAMIIGTAGLTAMLCVMALYDAGVKPEDGEILVTGASGGVGSTAVYLLSRLGYQVVALTGREENRDYLQSLGATDIMLREEMLTPAKPLEKQRWAGAVDTVGSVILAKTIAQMNYGGSVAACGLAGGFDLPTTVMPFILRGINLLGVDSVSCPLERRALAWQQLADLLDDKFYDVVSDEIGLTELPQYAEDITLGKITGRVLVKPA